MQNSINKSKRTQSILAMMRREAQALLNRLRTLNSTTKAGVGAPEQNRAVKAGHLAKVTSMSKATTASHEARAG